MPLWIDIKYACRLLLKKPLFTVTTAMIVAIGLGLTLYTYSLLSQLIFKPLTMNGDAPIIAIEGEFNEAHGRGQRADPFHLNQISAQSRLLETMSLYQSAVRTLRGLGDEVGARKVNLTYSQWNLFDVAGVQPILGRGFGPQDQYTGAESVVVLSYDVWQNQFAGDENIVGTMVQVEAIPNRVIGVMPEGFAFPAMAQVWQNMYETRMQPPEPSNRLGLNAVGRLKRGVSLAQFQQEMRAILQQHFVSLPQALDWRGTSPGGYIRAFDFKLSNEMVYHHYSVFIALLIVTLLILFLTSINVGNLLLARVNERIKDVAIRVALGVPQTRLVMQMLWESIVICFLGGIVGLLLAIWAVNTTNVAFEQIFLLNDNRPFWWVLAIDWDGILVLLAAILFMLLFTGLIPVLRALKGDVNTVLRDGTRGALGRKAGRASKALVIIEIALSCVVLVLASMLLSTSYSAQHADYGVDTENRLTAAVRLAWGSYRWNNGALDARKKRSDFYYRLEDELEKLPNIHEVAFFSSLPGTGGGSSHFEIQGKAAHVFNENPVWNFEVVSRDAWSSVGMRLIEGRNFDLRDTGSDVADLAASEAAVIINAALARDLFPDGDALGQKVRTVTEDWQTEWRTIIGVVSDTVHGSTMQSTSARHTGYGLMDRHSWWLRIVLHYSGPESEAEKALQLVINRMNADASVHDIQSYGELIKQPMLMVDAVNRIFLFCGLVALFLAASGIYAVAANNISLRRQEIATRRALGARDGQVIFLFLKQAAGQLMVGLTLGLLLSLWLLAQISQSMIIAGSSYFIGILGIPLFIILMVLIATYIPSQRATRQEPCEGLRQS